MVFCFYLSVHRMNVVASPVHNSILRTACYWSCSHNRNCNSSYFSRNYIPSHFNTSFLRFLFFTSSKIPVIENTTSIYFRRSNPSVKQCRDNTIKCTISTTFSDTHVWNDRIHILLNLYIENEYYSLNNP